MSNPARDSFSAKFTLMNAPEPAPSQAWSAVELANMDMVDEFDLPGFILRATILGRERTVRTIMERRGPVPIVLELNPLDPLDQKLNGVAIEIDTDYQLRDVKDAAGLKSLFSMIAEFGMKGLVDPHTAYPVLFRDLGLNIGLINRNRSNFSGALPELHDGVLHQPELVVALDAELGSAATRGAYKPMLCWATDDMLEQFPEDLLPLVHVQNVEGIGTMKQWKDMSDQPVWDFPKIEVGVEPSAACSDVAKHVQWVMTPEASKYGFEDAQGRHLCETTTDFLLQFPPMACEEKNLKAAFEFTENYCPIGIMAAQAAAVCKEKFGVEEERYGSVPSMKETMEHTFDFLFTALGDAHPLHEPIRNLMTRDQWVGLFKKASRVSAESMVALYQAFEIDNTGAGLSLNARDFKTLAAGGYRFSSQTINHSDSRFFDDNVINGDLDSQPSVFLPFNTSMMLSSTGAIQKYREIYRDILRTNLWPTSNQAPSNIGQALKMSLGFSLKNPVKQQALALNAYFLNAGVEACAEAVRSPRHWQTLAHVFSAEELKPYLAEMPREARGLVLEDGLGL